MESSLEGLSDARGEKTLDPCTVELRECRCKSSSLSSTVLVVISEGWSGGAKGIGGSSGLSADTPPRRYEEVSTVCGNPSSVGSISGSPSLITPFNASRRPVIRGDRFGDVGRSELHGRSIGSGEATSPPCFGTEEGTWTEDLGTLILTSCRNEQESENKHLPCE